MNKFKAGDKVRCINNKEGAEEYLVEGFVYDVTRSYGVNIDLDVFAGEGWWEERFELVQETFKGLETAYDQPDNIYNTEVLLYNPIVYEYPTTKGITMPKKSVQELASEVFNNLSGKNITAREIEQIVELVNSMKSIQEN